VTTPDPCDHLDVVIQDVTGRDGFQNVAPWIPTETKLALLRGIVGARVPWLEVTSFVHPKWVPQLPWCPTPRASPGRRAAGSTRSA